MPLGKTTDMLMYTPFVGVYEVPETIKKALTAEEFFKEDGCYVQPNFEKQIEKVYKSATDEVTGDDWPLTLREIVEALRSGKRHRELFSNWIDTSGDGFFTILGDAGTGKSTYLHHLKWNRREVKWCILDIKKAISNIEVGEDHIEVPRDAFVTLHGKVIASIIQEILRILFTRQKDGRLFHEKNRKTIQILLERYEDRIADLTPPKEYSILYRQLEEVQFDNEDRHSDRNYCMACASTICEYFNALCVSMTQRRDAEAKALRCALTHLLIVARSFEDDGRKVIFAFDNIERFIGSDEIYNKELTRFLYDLRGYCDQNREKFSDVEHNINLFSQKYQFVICMRNTTVRNHIPAEITDFKRHIADLSSWFPVDDIICSKLQWYDKHGINVIDEKSKQHLEYVLCDLGVSKANVLYGLRPKFDLIFNYNKRLTIMFLVELFEETLRPDHFQMVDSLFEKRVQPVVISSCAKFGYRSIIWRYLLDRMRDDNLFKKGVFFAHSTKNSRIVDTNYIWKILSVLHTALIENSGNETESSGIGGFVPFLELVRGIYNDCDNLKIKFFEDCYREERKRIARLLFYMNCYNPSDNNWFQLIDIQFNVDNAHRVHIEKWEDFEKLISNGQEMIDKLGVRITTAGKAYLGYVATSFEFFSCLAEKQPLVCCLPTKDELRNKPIDQYRCIQIIRSTIANIKLCIQDAEHQKDNPHLLYMRTAKSAPLTFKKRLVNCVSGFLSNFSDFVVRLSTIDDEKDKKKLDELAELISLETNAFTKECFQVEQD